ncbi:DUF5778 family protein [Haloquadratum walsbyi]|jgi:hypothetical protein|uniref:Uncharacterized protein n=1 Tax=Haloquadratum walsbyi J07HQW2 TaxID=1238425 RepID=U1MYI0_9EURY|nr:DUF5778 family protein [Haloquadratum walsbyi]ERG95549.1 MAG: hypothetical protein J07HQW2_02007 [Haloquadratum walsbyi J07HQW2]
MTDSIDEDLYQRTMALIKPGDVELVGAIVHTNLAGEEDLEMQELTVTINDCLAGHAGKGDTYIYAGNDSSEFASNQFQGLTIDDESFVWECQQLLREGTFDLVFYYKSGPAQAAVADDLESIEHVTDVTTVP